MPIPELVVVDDVGGMLSAFGPGGTDQVVDDAELSRYGALLDRAAERGLLTPAEYGIRLGELAAATTVDEMIALVTELPVLATGATPDRRGRGLGGTPSRRDAGPDGSPFGGRNRAVGATVSPGDLVGPLPAVSPGPGRSSPWFSLAVVVAVLVVAMVFFGVYAEHLIHAHSQGLPAGPAPVARVSALRS